MLETHGASLAWVLILPRYQYSTVPFGLRASPALERQAEKGTPLFTESGLGSASEGTKIGSNVQLWTQHHFFKTWPSS